MMRSKAGVTIASSIQFEDVSHSYGKGADNRPTLKNVNLDVSPGEVVCLLGPSGSGKTTLLRLAAGLAQPDSGKIFINHREVANANGLVPPEQRGVGLVFQDFALFPHLTIIKNVEFGLTQLSKIDRHEHALRMLETVGLKHAAENYPNQLSGGEQQRVALARALAPRPGILLMDEPFSGLDARLRESVREETLTLLRDTRSTVLIVTHDPEEALNIGDRIVLMSDGGIVQAGTCDQLYNSPNSLFSAQFFSELNRFDGIYDGRNVKSSMGEFPLPDQYNGALIGQHFQVCVRPSDFVVSAYDESQTSHSKRRQNDPEGDIFQAYVLSRRFVGNAELMHVTLPGDDMEIHLVVREGDMPAATSWVEIAVRDGKALIFPDE